MNLSASLVSDISPDSEAFEKPRATSLAKLRHLLSYGRNHIRKKFETRQLSGIATAQALSDLTDDIIQTLSNDAGGVTQQEEFCICAVGGYGAGLLAPFSDIDLLFLTPQKPDKRLCQKIEYILYTLWDLGLRVGHATRTIKESLELAQNDLTICTSLLDIRPIFGTYSLAHQLQEELFYLLKKEELREFIHAKITEREDRHSRFGDTPYVVEPHLKEGRGGLRDLQSLNWMGRAALHSSFPSTTSDYRKFDFTQACLSLGLLTEREAYRTKKIWNFLWAVRIHLHYIANRPEERLTFDVQPILGARMGYAYHGKQRAVERFMRHYFLIARSVMRITHILQPAILINTAHQQQESTEHKEDGPSIFQRIDGRLDIKDPSLFSTDPITLFRFLDTARHYRLKLAPAVKQQLIRHERYNALLRNNKEAASHFIALLCEPLLIKDDVEKEGRFWLPILNEIGLLPRYFHPWSRILGLTQFDSYHTYTVDEHTIEAVRILRQIEAGRMADELPLAYKIFQTTQGREILYIATLFHDIGKGYQGDHSEIGAQIAINLCQQLHLSADDSDTICWLIAHHLLLSQTAFRRDIDDPQTIFDLADTIQSPERLKLLLILTIADIRAVSPRAWNAWKATLLERLYHRVADVLEGGLQAPENDTRVQDIKTSLQVFLKDHIPAETIQQFISAASPGYWLSFGAETHLKHASLLHAFFSSDTNYKIDKEHSFEFCFVQKGKIAILLKALPQRGISELTILCHDRTGLFSLIAGTLASHGASISDARIHTFHNNLALDSFWIQNNHGEAFEEISDIETLKESLIRTLFSDTPPTPPTPPTQTRRLESLHIPSRVIIDNHASQRATIIEINGRDRPGLLHDMSAFFNKNALIISSAHITTYGLRAVDVFYIHHQNGEKIIQPDLLTIIRKDLLEILAKST